MFGTKALPHPSTFANEHRPLRLTSDSARQQPTGGCRYILLHPSAQNQRCSCQSFHHNRSAPGNICDCGHQACYHVHEALSPDKPPPLEAVAIASQNAISDRLKRLEEALQHERQSREIAIQRERQIWEREVRILREAMAPFYRREQDMRRKLIELEDKVEGNYDEEARLKDRLVAIDDANMALEKRVEELEDSRYKRRRVSRQALPEENPPLPNGHISPSSRRPSSTTEERSLPSISSRALSPNGVYQPSGEPEEPRSSGILNLVEMPRSIPLSSVRRTSPASDEPRSSGFLALDLVERLGRKSESEQPPDKGQISLQLQAARLKSPPTYARSNPDGWVSPRSPRAVAPMTNGHTVDATKSSPPSTSPKKRKYAMEHMALDVLADVSVASPLIH